MSEIYAHDVPSKEKQWLTDQIRLLCQETIIPALVFYKKETKICGKIRPQFHISGEKISGQSSIELLKDFARLKGKTVAEVIQNYIIDKNIIEQEKRLILIIP